ncbi:ribosomal protein S18-alanine N-acetyltransferase [Ruminococcaceae bacterium OttesenSCG-928-O06]|nr:ribosomal protein S18-alanine N-acetyltransferase [Ruminococcaceae bacterium OttesenSCG-928-O06]
MDTFTHLTVEPLSTGHLATVCAIAATAPDPWSRESLAAALADARYHCLVALKGQTPVGLACFVAAQDTADVAQLVVAPAARRRGVGRLLLGRGLAVLRAQGIKRVLLEVRQGNAAAIALYGSLGFHTLAVRRGMYQHPPEDGLLMALDIPPKTGDET